MLPLDIYKKLPGTNCGLCILPSCLAFAAAVARGQKMLRDCPVLAPELIEGLSPAMADHQSREDIQAEFLDKLQEKMADVQFDKIAPLIGATVKENQIIINSLGKDFVFDSQGNMTSECHVIPWVKVPLLSCITNKTHGDVTGRWISFREIKGGIDWQGLFSSRCENPLRKLADANPSLLGDLIDLFQGKAVDWYQADIALILYPLPKFPILICYQAPEDDLESVLTLFFDESCETNLHIKSIFTLCSGLVQMFTKIAEHHL